MYNEFSIYVKFPRITLDRMHYTEGFYRIFKTIEAAKAFAEEAIAHGCTVTAYNYIGQRIEL